MKRVLLLDGPRAGEVEEVADNAVGVAAGARASGPWYRSGFTVPEDIDEVWSVDPATVAASGVEQSGSSSGS